MTFIPHTAEQRARMLAEIGAKDLEDLLRTIPAELRLDRPLKVPEAQGEAGVCRTIHRLVTDSQQIALNRTFAGGGVYPHFVPAVVNELSHRGEFYTAYTPYQPEVSQGMLQCIYEYQSYICLLTGMEVSNASGYDGGTTLADSVLMSALTHKGKRNKVIFAPHVDPQAKDVVAAYNIGMELELVTGNPPDGRYEGECGLKKHLDDDTTCVVFQYPDCLGNVDPDLAQRIEETHAAGALAIVMFYPFAAGMLRTPGELGADIVCGEAQCLGNPMGCGGPLLGYLGCREKLVRVMPGRLIGRTVCERDGGEGEGFVMTLQAREQHIRRVRATSNICSNEALLALRTCIYMGAVGRSGFTQLAGLCHDNALACHAALTAIDGVRDYYDDRMFFNEFTVLFPAGKRDAVYDRALEKGILAGIKPDARQAPDLKDALTFACTEVHTQSDIDALANCVKEVL